MAYCELADLEKALTERTLIQLTDDLGAGVVDEDIAEDAITRADGEIDMYLTRYQLPLSETASAGLRDISTAVAIYKLYSRVMEEVPSTRRDNYLDAVRKLEGIRDGKMDLGTETEPEASTSMVRWYAV